MYVIPHAIRKSPRMILKAHANVNLVMIVLTGLDHLRPILFKRPCRFLTRPHNCDMSRLVRIGILEEHYNKAALICQMLRLAHIRDWSPASFPALRPRNPIRLCIR